VSDDTRNRYAETWQRLANIRIPVPGLGAVSVEEMMQQISASDADPTTRAQLLRELDNLAAVLAPLPPAARDEVIERVADAICELHDGAST
jgi:hypothetical protein